MGYSITIQQAVNFCQLFQAEAENAVLLGKNDFDKARVKRLSPSDRKVCMVALRTIEKAKLADWAADDPSKKIDQDRLDNITKKIKEEREALPPAKTPWYKVPFVWIARIVHRLVVGFKNTFLGRISSDKLWNKIRTYREDWRNANPRIKDIDENILELRGVYNEKITERNVIISNKIQNGLLKAYNLFLEMKASREVQRGLKAVIDGAHSDGANDLPYKTDSQVIVEILAPYYQENFGEGAVQAPLQQTFAELYDAAKSECENPTGDVGAVNLERLFDQSLNTIKLGTKEIEDRLYKLRNEHITEAGFDNAQAKQYGYEKLYLQKEVLKSEKKLLIDKYALPV